MPPRSGRGTLRSSTNHFGRITVPRYLIERSFAEGLGIPATHDGAAACVAVARNNAEEGVTWVHSYVTTDKRTSYCVYDGPNPEAIRRAAQRNRLPVNRITEVRVLDPYFYL